MNTATGYTRVNLTISKDIIEYLKHNTENMSKYISEAVRERIVREKREKALREICLGSEIKWTRTPRFCVTPSLLMLHAADGSA